MALSDTSFDSETGSQTVAKRYDPSRSRGDNHSILTKKGLQLKRLAGRRSAEIMREIIQLALHADSESVRLQASQLVLERAFGKAASAPEDIQAMQVIAAAPAQFLMQLLNMRNAALQQQPLDITPDATPALPQECK